MPIYVRGYGYVLSWWTRGRQAYRDGRNIDGMIADNPRADGHQLFVALKIANTLLLLVVALSFTNMRPKESIALGSGPNTLVNLMEDQRIVTQLFHHFHMVNRNCIDKSIPYYDCYI